MCRRKIAKTTAKILVIFSRVHVHVVRYITLYNKYNNFSHILYDSVISS